MEACSPHGGGEDGSFLSSYDFCCGQYIRWMDAYVAAQTAASVGLHFLKKSAIYFTDLEQSA